MGRCKGSGEWRVVVRLSLAFLVCATLGACLGPRSDVDSRPTLQLVLATDGTVICVTDPFAAMDSPAQGRRTSDPTFARDPGFENTLPANIFGRSVQHLSVGGDATIGYYPFGIVGAVAAKCLGRSVGDVTTAVAYSPSTDDLDGWSVIGVKIRDVPGSILEATMLGADKGSLKAEPPSVRTVAGKTYRVYSHGYLAVYATADAMYVILQWTGGDYYGPSSRPPIDQDALFADVIRQLP